MRLFDENNGIKQYSRLMQPKTILSLLLAGSAAWNAGAQSSTNEVRKTRVLGLAESIELGLKNNLDIQIQRYNPIIGQFALDISYGVYEPVFNLSATKSYNDSPGRYNPYTSTIVNNTSETDAYAPEIKGILPTGMTYDITSGPLLRESTRVYPVGQSPYWGQPAWISGPGISLDQPLLRNFWIDNNRLQIKLNRAQLHISEQQLRLQIMASITAIKSNYYNLLYARGNVDANATALKLAQQLVTENLTRVEVGALAPLDEKQSESQAAASLAALQVAQQALAVQENAFKNLLTDNYSEWAGVTPIPSEELVAVPQELNLQESWRHAVSERPEIVEAKLSLEKQNITLKYQFNQMFPALDLTGSWGVNAYGTTLGDNLDGVRSTRNQFYSYGVNLSMPIGGNFAARDTYKSGKVTVKQLLLQLKQTEQNIVVQVENDVGAVRSTLQQVHSTRDARIYAEDALKAERTKLENGKSTSFIVLQLISTLTTARVAEVQALANYNIAVAQLELDEAATLDVNHVDIKVK